MNSSRVYKFLFGFFAGLLTLTSHSALDISQVPLLTQAGSVSPNLMLILDDSGSMKAQYIYQYGGTAGGYGMPGPGVTGKQATCPSGLSINVTCSYNKPTVTVGSPTAPPNWTAQNYDFGDLVTYGTSVYKCDRDSGCEASREPTQEGRRNRRWVLDTSSATSSGAFYEVSPDVNRMYYDPRVLYKPRATGVGTALTTAATSTTDDFFVFFYKNSSGNSVVWPGSGNSPTDINNYFNPYTPLNALTNADSKLATGANATLNYPRCVGNTACGNAGPFPKFANRTDCDGTTLLGSACTLANERQNYANWKKFHSNRLDLAKTGLGFAFQEISTGLRLGWGLINDISSTSLGTTGSGVGAFDQARKNAFYTWLYSIPPSGSTPLRESLISIGKYFSRADNLGPWADTPDTSSKGLTTLSTSSTDTQAKRKAHASCRRSYAMMMTDGYYNDSAPATEDTDFTSATTVTGTTPAGATLTYTYNGTTKPFSAKSTFTTLADIAMKYWVNDLRPTGSGATDFGLVNNVPQSKVNESFWQNVGFYAVGLGIDGTLVQDTTTLANLSKVTGATTWPEPDSDGNDRETIDDMWHATINARGRMLSARNAAALSDGVEGMLAEITNVVSSQSGVAASTLSLTTTTKKYTPNYTTGAWIGNVVASNLEPKTGAELCTQWRVFGTWAVDPNDSTKKHWYVGGNPDGTTDLPPCSGAPSTFNGIAAHGSRNVYAWDGAAFGQFDTSNTYVMSASTGIASDKATPGDTNLVNYLRGDQSNEDVVDAKGVVLTPKTYRARPTVLGDIVNSTPTFIKGALNAGYDKLPANTFGQNTYSAFVTAKTNRTEGVLFAGANDGMLHGFRESTGAEVFAFVPRAVMPKMHQLASRSYNHQYFVDGTTVEADACIGTSAACVWKNLLIGTAGAGAKTVFGLDVTSPMTMTASNIKWEITPSTGATSSTTPFGNLGNILTDVQTGLARNDEWVAVFGNGYNGGTGTNASLFIINLDTGSLIKEIVVPTTIPVTGGDNGLGGVRLLRDSNQKIIAAYAGDLKGNMWKFDLSSTNPNVWSIALSGQPIYQTADTTVPAKQPISAAPTLVKHPTNGYVVTFGTGKLFETGDTSTNVTQSLYGVWDSITPTPITQIDRTSLVRQTISSAIAGTTVITNIDSTTSTVALNYYAVSRNPVAWTSDSSTPRGWYIDLPNTGQRLIYPIEALAGTYAATDTVSPASVTANPCLASGSGRAWNYVIDLVTGSGPPEAIFSNNGGITGSTYVSGYENFADGRTRYIKNDALSTPGTTAFTPLSTQQLPSFSISCALQGTCSTTIIRTWRQLFMR